MIVYAESSAVLAWLFREAAGLRVESILANADYVFASDLTLVECDRAAQREAASGRITEATARQVAADLASYATAWETMRLLPAIIERARQRFPHEPIRSLDALHVASALHARTAHADLAFLSLDERVRRVSTALGFDVLPH